MAGLFPLPRELLWLLAWIVSTHQTKPSQSSVSAELLWLLAWIVSTHQTKPSQSSVSAELLWSLAVSFGFYAYICPADPLYPRNCCGCLSGTCPQRGVTTVAGWIRASAGGHPVMSYSRSIAKQNIEHVITRCEGDPSVACAGHSAPASHNSLRGGDPYLV